MHDAIRPAAITRLVMYIKDLFHMAVFPFSDVYRQTPEIITLFVGFVKGLNPLSRATTIVYVKAGVPGRAFNSANAI
jgi:hypothetical protein